MEVADPSVVMSDDTEAYRLDLARTMGADHALDASDPATAARFLEATNGEGGCQRFNAQSDVPADTSDFDSPSEPAAVGAPDDDIPF